MGTYRRINVASGRQLEKLAHYSRALRVGDMVLQSGTTAIDREGTVIGEGDIARQVDAIMSIAEWSMDKAGGKLEDVVRSRIYVTDMSLADQAIAFGSGKLDEVDVRSMLGSIDQSAVFDIAQALAQSDGAGVLAAVQALSEHAPDYQSALEELR